MGETMSKRLKLHLGGDAEMEERAFANPFPDYEAAASAVFGAGATEEAGCARPLPAADEPGLPFHNDGKVSRPGLRPRHGGSAGGGSVHPSAVASAGPPRGAMTLPCARRAGSRPRGGRGLLGETSARLPFARGVFVPGRPSEGCPLLFS